MTKSERSEWNIAAEAVMPILCQRLAAGQTVHNLPFQGVSMRPMLRQGKDTVELTQLPDTLKKYDLPVYRGVDGKFVMHRVVGAREGYYICLGDNTYHYEKVAPERMVALVCAFSRNGRRISVENRGYRLYCRLWCAIYPARKGLQKARWWAARHIKKVLKR